MLFYKIFISLIWAVFLLLLAGCGTPSQQLLNSDFASIDLKTKGVVIGGADFFPSRCMGSAQLAIAVKNKDTYENVERNLLGVERGESKAAPGVVIMSLPPGHYHIMEFSCSTYLGNSIKTQTLTSAEKNAFLGYGNYKRSYASFSVKAGEVVNIGFLSLDREISDDRLSNIRVIDIHPVALEALKAKQPVMMGKIIKRYMVVHKRTPEEIMKDICSKDIDEITQNENHRKFLKEMCKKHSNPKSKM